MREDLRQAGPHLGGRALFAVELDAHIAGVGLQVRQSPRLAAGLVVQADAEVPGSRRRILDPSSSCANAWPQRRLPYDLDRDPKAHRLSLERPPEVAVPWQVVLTLVSKGDLKQYLLPSFDPRAV